MNSGPDPKTQPVRAAIDSTVMLVLARFAMPAVVAVLGWFITTTLDSMKIANTRIWLQLEKIGDAQAATTIAQGGLAVKVDGAIKQIDRLQAQVDSLPKHN